VVERKVFLRGSVSTVERLHHITDVVRELLPDHEVHNDVVVDAPTTPHDIEKV
jgi:hypothetical protein